MVKKIDTKLDADVQSGEAAQGADPISDDGSHGDINNVAAADAEPEIIAAEQLNDAEAGQSADPLIAITAERDALKDQLLRALADTENMRRRSEREADTARSMGTHNSPVIWSGRLTI